MPSYARSEELYAQALDHMAGGVSSNFRYGTAPVPLFYTHAEGPRLHDVDGNVCIDYMLANGPAILGHAPAAVLSRVAGSLGLGQLFGGQHADELELAKRLTTLLPCADLVRFASSGSEVVHAALRAARAHTGRPLIVKFEGHYHGWLDNILVSASPSLNEAGPVEEPVAVPHSPGQLPSAYSEVVVLPWNDLGALAAVAERHRGEIAGVIMEPMMLNSGGILPLPGYLEGVRELCTADGIVLIFDEVITGFRVGLGGAQTRLGVTPDLALFAKAVAAGFPLAVIAGRRDIMSQFREGGVLHGGTYNAAVLSMAAALATLDELGRDGGRRFDEMERRGERLMAGLRAGGAEHGHDVLVQGLGMIFHMGFTDQAAFTDYRDLARSDMAKRMRFCHLIQHEGVRITPRGIWFMSMAHEDSDIEETIEAADRAFARLAEEG
jgi:glutamate-1-semialdehyde 2,1-aminomutase